MVAGYSAASGYPRDAIEDSDDVQDVYANYNVADDVMEKLES